MARAHHGELGEYPLHLPPLLDLKLAQLVVRLDYRHRLDKQCRTRCGGVVHKALYLVLVLALYGDDKAPAALRHDILLQILAVPAADIPLQRLLYPAGSGAHLPSDVRERGARLVRHHILRENGAGNARFRAAILLEAGEIHAY